MAEVSLCNCFCSSSPVKVITLESVIKTIIGPCPVQGSPVQKRQGCPGDSTAEGHKDDKGAGTSSLREKAEQTGCV